MKRNNMSSSTTEAKNISHTSVDDFENKEEEKTNESPKNTAVTIPKIENEDFAQLGTLMNRDTLTVELDDIEEYLRDRKRFESYGKGEYKTPFIIYLNSKFVGTVRSNKKIRKVKSYLTVILLLILVGALGFGLGKLLNVTG